MLKVVPLRNSPYIKARKEGVIRALNPLTKTPLQRSDDMAELNNIEMQALLKELLHYDAETGIFTWRESRGRLAKAGQVAGYTCSTGYRSIRFMGKDRKAHRLAWLYTHGEWPSGVIDHINCERADNRIENLRDVSYQGNSQNRRKARSNSLSGLMGVAQCQGKFQSWIHLADKSRLHLGTFKTAEEAHTAYVEAKRVHHPTNTL